LFSSPEVKLFDLSDPKIEQAQGLANRNGRPFLLVPNLIGGIDIIDSQRAGHIETKPLHVINPDPNFAERNENYMVFLQLRRELNVLDKVLAAELGVSPRGLTERVTGRATIKLETLLAMRYLIATRDQQ
jgi:hypothetical protein